MKSSNNITLVILAAGKSSRMNTVKQLLPWKDGTLLSNAIEIGASSEASSVIVVLGAHSEKIKLSIEQSGVVIVENDRWQDGLGSSIACAINYIKNQNIPSDGVLFSLADMPFISVKHLNNLIANFELNSRSIVVTSTAEKSMVPAIFDRCYFEELSQLSGDFGAKEILKKHSKYLKFVTVKSSQIVIDLDTPEEYSQNKSS